MTADQDSSIALAGSPPQVFPDVGVLLWRREFWTGWLNENPGKAELLAAAYGQLVRLTSHTGWTEDRVLARLGCDSDSDEELRKLASERLGLCGEYFAWVVSLLGELDLPSDKRLIVSGAARFFAAAGEDVERCEEIMASGSFSPLEYLRLGEIAQSWQCAIRALSGSRGDRARETYEQNPFADERAPHLSPRRLAMLSSENPQAFFGIRVEQRVRKHVKDCPVCEEAYERGKDDHAHARAGDAPALTGVA